MMFIPMPVVDKSHSQCMVKDVHIPTTGFHVVHAVKESKRSMNLLYSCTVAGREIRERFVVSLYWFKSNI